MARNKKQMALINGCIIADDVQPYFYDDNKAWLRDSRHVDGISTAPSFMDYNKIKTIVWFTDFSDLMGEVI